MEKQVNSLSINKSEGVATIHLNRPKKKNTITLKMWKEIPKILNEMEADTDVKTVIIRGADETVFSAGADINEFVTEREKSSNAMNYDMHVTNAGDALESFSKPLIAMIEGPCIGGGCDLALACDLRFSSVTGVFGITPAKIGLVYGVPQTKRLVETVGPSRAKDILFSGRFLNAKEAYNIGLVDRVYKTNEIIEKTYSYAKLLGERSQITIHGAKKINKAILEKKEDTKEIKNVIYKSYYSTDIQEGVLAFQEKRPPEFKE